jgi:hypothetical protein
MEYLRHGKIETVVVVNWTLFASAIVVTKDLLVKVAVKMEWFDSNVSSAKVALQQAPEVLQPIGMNLSVNVPLGVIDELMDISRMELVVSVGVIGINLASVLHIGEHFVLEGFTLDIGQNLGANLSSTAVKDADDNSFTVVSTALLVAQTAFFVQLIDFPPIQDSSTSTPPSPPPTLLPNLGLLSPRRMRWSMNHADF